jgi:hypothetical protein
VTCAPCCLWPPRYRPSARRRRSSGRRCRRRVAVRSAGCASRAARCDGRTCWEGCGRAWWPRRGEGPRREEKFGWPEARLDDLVWQIFGDFLLFFLSLPIFFLHSVWHCDAFPVGGCWW